MRAGIYTYAWDLAAEGHAAVLGRLAAAGFSAVNLACAYHAAKLLLPHNPRRRVYFAEDGALYFRPTLARYGPLQPRVSELVTARGDPLTDLDRERRKHGLDLVAWVVCLHNSWLGERYQDRALRNAFGDPYPHSLCPAHPDVQAYLVALVTDVVTRAEVAALELESPGYMGFAHGFHHEIIGVPLDAAQEVLLGLSFTPAELARAREAGIDGEGVRQRVARALTDSWSAGAGCAEQLLRDPEVMAYLALREEVVTQLLARVREAVRVASPRTEVRLFASPGARPPDGVRAVELADGVLAGYAPSDAEAQRRARELGELAGGKPVYGMLRAIAPDTVDPARVAPRVAAWRDGGVAGIDFYNYGLMTLPMLAAIGAALGGG